jgi:hypothetical protein
VDSRLIARSPSRFELPTNQENLEFENKIDQQQENIHLY